MKRIITLTALSMLLTLVLIFAASCGKNTPSGSSAKKEKKAADWYFTQGESIFVRTNDSRAMMWHVKQSARYMHYYPAEAITNFMKNFAHSMSHIEE